MEAMRTTYYQKPTSFRSNTEPESLREAGIGSLGGNEMEAMRAQQEKFEPTTFQTLSPSTSSSAAAAKSWSELSQSEHHSDSETVKGEISEVAKEGSGGKSWGEVRSDSEGRGIMLNPLSSEPKKADKLKLKQFNREENKHGSGKDTASITKEKKKEKGETKAAEEVRYKEDKVKEKKSSDREEEKLEPERTMEGLAESSEEANSLQAFRAVEKR